MSAWPGRYCPACGEWMHPLMIHCRACRQLDTLEPSSTSVEIPDCPPLQELDSMAEINPAGMYLPCPKCHEDLKINRKYIGQRIQCKFCQAEFRLDPTSPAVRQADVYSHCPHCQQQIRF